MTFTPYLDEARCLPGASPLPPSAWWEDATPDEHSAAAAECRRCPVLAACRRQVLAAAEDMLPSGIVAGLLWHGSALARGSHQRRIPVRAVCEVCRQEFYTLRRRTKACSARCRRLLPRPPKKEQLPGSVPPPAGVVPLLTRLPDLREVPLDRLAALDGKDTVFAVAVAEYRDRLAKTDALPLSSFNARI